VATTTVAASAEFENGCARKGRDDPRHNPIMTAAKTAARGRAKMKDTFTLVLLCTLGADSEPGHFTLKQRPKAAII
jgi:hypothetical protein